MKLLLLLFLCSFHCIGAQDLKSLIDFCAKAPATPPKSLSDKIKLPDVYKVTGSFTDFIKATTSLLVESSSPQFRVLQSHTRNQLPNKWIEELTGEKASMFVNMTSGECTGMSPKPKLINYPSLNKVIGDDSSSFASMINGLLEFNKAQSGYVVDNESEIVAGVNTVKWISCVNGTAVNDTKLIVEVRYADDLTPAAEDPFGSPLLVSIRIAELPTFNSTTPINHVSLELDRYELPSGNEASLPHGIYCSKRNSTNIPLKNMDEYAAFLDYYDHSTNTSEVIEILYSKSRQILIISGNSLQNGVQLIRASNELFKNGTDYLVHDFKYGYQFAMSRDACLDFGTLFPSTYDVIKEINETIAMRKLEEMLIDPLLRFDPYENDIDIVGLPLRTFRAYDVRDDTIYEAHLTTDNELLSLAKFHTGSKKLGTTLTITPIPVESSRLNMKLVQLSDCYDSGKFANNTWIMNIKNKNVTDIEKVGLNALNEALTTSITNNVYPVIPYRILTFWVEDRNGGLSIMLRVSEKSQIQPANVAGYNYTAELGSFELFKLINETIYADKLPIQIVKVDGTKEEWSTDANSMKLFPPETDNGFIGYTGGAMFVLAVFCLLIGVSIGAVGVFVATRRQRISTLAYQVFE
ncbi:unnamed protein product [Caenorhabditis bovis]|uniref:Uncharacterized protein n=1 Tax=Caenorhabditis bovis TaxID=2654633 RepID=A0A8S1EWC2_9PELO|nr:unnamed protein product [Caenorhabditis bovis]